MVTIFWVIFFLELQKKLFFHSGQAPNPLSGRATTKITFFAASLSNLISSRPLFTTRKASNGDSEDNCTHHQKPSIFKLSYPVQYVSRFYVIFPRLLIFSFPPGFCSWVTEHLVLCYKLYCNAQYEPHILDQWLILFGKYYIQ